MAIRAVVRITVCRAGVGARSEGAQHAHTRAQAASFSRLGLSVTGTGNFRPKIAGRCDSEVTCPHVVTWEPAAQSGLFSA